MAIRLSFFIFSASAFSKIDVFLYVIFRVIESTGFAYIVVSLSITVHLININGEYKFVLTSNFKDWTIAC